ncbi:MAG TPA: NAD(P)/FAD-dependent oxidoreductase [Candidatus Angelobacter sp.]|nr:NAD(P)/FAD-dependent oxidoreductase [Candidatus Angelobacter sp.]
MVSGIPYKQARLGDTWDAIVIGSGIGGLTAAVLLAVHGGKRVLVLERHYEVGGFTHTFRRPGYEWDVGLHYIGQVQDERSPVRRAFDYITAGGVRWQAMPEIYDRFIIAGQSFELNAGVDRFRDALTRYFPAEAGAIDRYLRAVRSCNRLSNLYFAEKAIPRPAAALAGGLMRLPYLRWARRTTRQVLESFTANRELMGVLAAQWGDYGLPPAESSFAVHATIAEHYFAGASYPIRGASSIASAMVPRIFENGGAVLSSAEVAEIVVEGARAAGVRMNDGREFRAPMIVSDAGAANTFERLLPADSPGSAALNRLRRQVRTIRPSTAHLSLYVGLSQSDAELGTRGSNIWVYPSFDHDANVERFATDIESPFPGIYISFPSAKDPDFQRRHPGKSTIEVITMVPFAGFARWEQSRWKRRGEEYGALKERLASRLRAELERQVPLARNCIAYTELSTPVTTRHFMNYSHGEIYGLASTPERYALRDLGARTPLRGLYLTGQDVATLGVVGAMFGGIICASVALGKNLLSAVNQPRE